MRRLVHISERDKNDPARTTNEFRHAEAGTEMANDWKNSSRVRLDRRMRFSGL
jgi:hypothetical protein